MRACALLGFNLLEPVDKPVEIRVIWFAGSSAVYRLTPFKIITILLALLGYFWL